MKYVFCRNITKNKNNERIDGEIFITQRIDAAQEKALEDAEDLTFDVYDKASLGCLASIIEIICMIATYVCIVKIIDRIGSSSLAETYHSIPWAFYILAVVAPAWITLVIINRVKKNKFNDSGEAAQAELNFDRVSDESYKMLGVPEGAITLDVLTSEYKIKNGELKHQDCFENSQFKAFINGTDICFANVHERFDVPLDGARLVRIRKSGTLDEWHKSFKPQKEHYRLDPTNKSSNRLKFRYCGEMRFNYMATDYAVIFPPHELSEVEKLTGLTLTEE